MINLLFDPLPECVQVDGVDYPVATDFRDWIAFADLILDPGISQQNKVAAAMQWYPDARPPDATKALHALKWFFTAEPLLTERQQRRMDGKPTRPVLSYSQDAAYILGAFRQCYGMDLIRIDYLHYWEFRSLMQALPEDCPLKNAWHTGRRIPPGSGMMRNGIGYGGFRRRSPLNMNVTTRKLQTRFCRR